MRVAKTKALISFAVTAKLICVFVFAYAYCLFSHEVAHLSRGQKYDLTYLNDSVTCNYRIINQFQFVYLKARLICAFIFSYAFCWF